MSLESAFYFSTWIIPVLLAITLHEASHGYVACYFGDDTAKNRNRLSLNPFRHIDMVGTIVLPLLLFIIKSPFLFGWAKPVPVTFSRLRKPKRDMIWVAIAGPFVNFVLAFLSAFAIAFLVKQKPSIEALWLVENARNSLSINIVLMIFNLIPIPPLDGGRVVTGLLPVNAAVKYASIERHGMEILVFVFFILPYIGDTFGADFNFLGNFLRWGKYTIGDVFLSLAGI